MLDFNNASHIDLSLELLSIHQFYCNVFIFWIDDFIILDKSKSYILNWVFCQYAVSSERIRILQKKIIIIHKIRYPINQSMGGADSSIFIFIAAPYESLFIDYIIDISDYDRHSCVADIDFIHNMKLLIKEIYQMLS
ncbi:MAG: hypothetical protein ACD_2C00113G0001 [uncultured bacterium (gcode 4)]|uniref:Uncharacterized protein n=1 Tax=uncultured bacterium (gcode 4) TaxID=1234023 RepID=K2H1K7_9BACT|nr:MAG: hypothetical protein ACD_2C00113G0001 [uncultured bacterium (gcode 4)]